MKKTVLITGAAKSLGKELALELAKSGYDLVLHYFKSETEVKELAKELKALQTVQAELTKPEEVTMMFEQIKSPIDILINNVGDFIYQPLLETDIEEFEYTIHNNLMSAWYCSKQVLDQMIEKNYGKIINFGCVNCDQLTSRPNTTPYYIAKTSLLMLTRSLAQELKNTEIKVNMISPGVMPTGHSATNPEIKTIPFQAVVKAVKFLIDDQNQYINGANLEVGAGWRPQ